MNQEFNLYYKEEFIGTYTATQIADKLGLTELEVLEMAVAKRPYKHHRWNKIYNANLVEHICYDEATKKVCKEWDRFTEPYRNRN